jgi:hypothetical protein
VYKHWHLGARSLLRRKVTLWMNPRVEDTPSGIVINLVSQLVSVSGNSERQSVFIRMKA